MQVSNTNYFLALFDPKCVRPRQEMGIHIIKLFWKGLTANCYFHVMSTLWLLCWWTLSTIDLVAWHICSQPQIHAGFICTPSNHSKQMAIGTYKEARSLLLSISAVASHQTFSGQNKHLSDQIKLPRQIYYTSSMGISLSLLKIINVRTIFGPYHMHWYMCVCTNNQWHYACM